MKNKEDTFDDWYDSDGEIDPFNNRTDKEGPQLFNEDDDDGVGFVAERLIGDEEIDDTAVDDTTDVVVIPDHVPIDFDTMNKMNMVLLRVELKLRQQAVTGRKLELRDRSIKALDKMVPKYTEESLAKKKADAAEAKKKNQTEGLSSIFKNCFLERIKTK
jgi:hypothetical protein